MKYIDADKLREEVEFAKSVYSNPQRVVHGIADAFRQDGRAAMCDDILKKLEPLQQEQPEVEGVVHHVATVHYIETNYEQLNACLKQFEEGTEVVITINARKEKKKCGHLY